MSIEPSIPKTNINPFVCSKLEATMQIEDLNEAVSGFINFWDCARLNAVSKTMKAATTALVYDPNLHPHGLPQPIQDVHRKMKGAERNVKEAQAAFSNSEREVRQGEIQIRVIEESLRKDQNALDGRLKTWRGWLFSKINVPSGILSVIGKIFLCIFCCLKREGQEQNILKERIHRQPGHRVQIHEQINLATRNMLERKEKLDKAKEDYKTFVYVYDTFIKRKKYYAPIIDLFGNMKIFNTITTVGGSVCDYDKKAILNKIAGLPGCIFRLGSDTNFPIIAFRIITRKRDAQLNIEIDVPSLHLISHYGRASWANKSSQLTRYRFTNENVYKKRLDLLQDGRIVNSSDYQRLQKICQMTYRLVQTNRYKTAAHSQNGMHEHDEKHSKEKEEKSKAIALPSAIPLAIHRPSLFVEELFGGIDKYRQIPVYEKDEIFALPFEPCDDEPHHYYLNRFKLGLEEGDSGNVFSDAFGIVVKFDDPDHDGVVYLSHIAHPVLNDTLLDDFPVFWRKDRVVGDDVRGDRRQVQPGELTIHDSQVRNVDDLIKHNKKPKTREKFIAFIEQLKAHLVQKNAHLPKEERVSWNNIGAIPRHIVEVLK